MRTTRKLSLKRERLSELRSEELDGLAGGLSSEARIKFVVGASTIPVTACCVTDSTCVSFCSECIDTFQEIC